MDYISLQHLSLIKFDDKFNGENLANRMRIALYFDDLQLIMILGSQWIP